MFAKNNLTESGVKKNKIAENQENFSIFYMDEHKSFPKFCKQNCEITFKRKNLQISDCFNKLGKSILLVSNDMFYVLMF